MLKKYHMSRDTKVSTRRIIANVTLLELIIPNKYAFSRLDRKFVPFMTRKMYKTGAAKYLKMRVGRIFVEQLRKWSHII